MRARQARRFSLRAQALTKVNLANKEHLQKNKYRHLKPPTPPTFELSAKIDLFFPFGVVVNSFLSITK